MGNLHVVVEQLRKERTRLAEELHRVTAALTAFGNVYISGSKTSTSTGTSQRTISAAGRERIAAAQRARWAKQKGKNLPAKAKRTMSATSRKKIAAAQRARWAKIKGPNKAA